ncbi:P-loop NTPase family protein [Catelliglobosispora koreensis]|uniref:hypothetical protein n=1 Tax=Catelliglobosispora koreensis TaxID=129052 RepID=UPI000379EE7E|nr:hypothetical protein [Catelliglobosispora koreensis]
MTALDEMVWTLLNEAAEVYGAGRIQPLFDRLGEPLRVGVAGGPKCGKSTLINTFLGDRVAPLDIGQTFTRYEDGAAVGMMAHYSDGTRQELSLARGADGAWACGQWADGAEEVVVSWPSRVLRHLSLVDSKPDCLPPQVDALLYLDATDFQPLEMTLGVSAVTRAAPVDVIGVLSRADEVGGGRVDALVSARQLARALSREPSANSVTVTIVAVSGLLAQAGLSLSEDDFELLASLATMPREDLDDVLLSADRFVGNEFFPPTGYGQRRDVLNRLGIHGLRLASALVRTGTHTRADLASELIRRSGLPELQEVLNYHVIERRDLLKSRSALIALEALMEDDPPPAELAAQFERVLASAHEFRELRLLASLRNSSIGFASPLAKEARRLAGGDGPSTAARLGLDQEVPSDELFQRGVVALRRWQEQADDPQLSARQRRAARIVVRSCEEMLTSL